MGLRLSPPPRGVDLGARIDGLNTLLSTDLDDDALLTLSSVGAVEEALGG